MHKRAPVNFWDASLTCNTVCQKDIFGLDGHLEGLDGYMVIFLIKKESGIRDVTEMIYIAAYLIMPIHILKKIFPYVPVDSIA